MSEGSPDSNIIRFQNRQELQEKSNLLKKIEKIHRGVTLAYEGGGEKKKPDDLEKKGLLRMMEVLSDFKKELKTLDDATATSRFYEREVAMKLGLIDLLSDSQFIEVFGTDNLA